MKILVIEDDFALGPNLQMLLEEAGHTVDLASTGLVALKFLAGMEYDLLLADYQLPGGVSGRDIARMARQTSPALWVIFTSGNPSHDPSAEFSPRSHFLAKPFEMDYLESLIVGLR